MNIAEEFLNDLECIIKNARKNQWNFGKIVDEIYKQIKRY